MLPGKANVIKIGIVGAGAAGLFTAMILDHLNEKLSQGKNGAGNLVFEYEILEANSSERLGGRLFTYKFPGDGDPHNYYDVGAMRFPKNPVMKRVFDLFHKLGMDIDSKPQANTPDGTIIPYYMNNGGVDSPMNEPWRYNDITLWGNSFDHVREQSTEDDPFEMARSTDIPPSIRRYSPGDVMSAAIQPLREALKRDLETKPPGKEGWELLMKYDALSTRQFLRTSPSEPPPKGDNKPPPPPYNYDTVQWMETFNGGTDWYDQAHSETVLENLDFEYSEKTPWYCIQGGAQMLGRKMHDNISQKATFNSPVTSIRAIEPMKVELEVATPSPEKKTFNAVFNTTTLSCLGKMDISNAGLNYATKQACRTLGYGASAKVGIKFKRAWWIHDLGKFNIKSGGLGHSDLMLRTCVYPSYNIHDDASKPAVLLCSYTWQQDAQRLASLFSSNADPNQKNDESALKELLLRELALLHANSEQTAGQLYTLISENYIDHHAFDWYRDQTTMGAFAFFRPQQFSNVWNKLIHPSGDVVIIGEAASPHHAWVIGALESAVHGIHSWLGLNRGVVPEFEDAMKILEREEKGNPFTGLPPYMDANLSRWHSIMGLINREEIFKDTGAVATLIPQIKRATK